MTSAADTATAQPGHVSNSEFARRAGCHYTMASRLRSGQRLPSAALLSQIGRAFDIPSDALLKARDAGPAEFARLLGEYVP